MENSKDDVKDQFMEEEERKEEESVTKSNKCLHKFGLFVLNNYLPISLVLLVLFGALVPEPGNALNTAATKYVCITLIFIYTGLYLQTKAIKEAVSAYKAAIWGFVSILGVTCIVGGSLTDLLNDTTNISPGYERNSSNISMETKTSIGPVEFRYGLQIYMVMPCTVSSGVVMGTFRETGTVSVLFCGKQDVMQLNGHFALAVLLTVVCNIIGIFTVPLYIKWLLFQSVSVSFDIPSLLMKLSLTILLPIIVGKALRSIKRVRKFVKVPNHKRILKTISITLLVIIVWVKVSSTSYNGQLNELSLISVLFIVGWALAMHTLFIIINVVATIILRLPKDQQKCIIILASQKTMAVGVSVIAFLPETLGEIGLIAIGMVVGHISILILDSVLIPVWLNFEKGREQKDGEIQMESLELRASE